MCFSNIRLLLHNNPLGALVSQQVLQTQAGLNPSKHEKKMEISLMFFPGVVDMPWKKCAMGRDMAIRSLLGTRAHCLGPVSTLQH